MRPEWTVFDAIFTFSMQLKRTFLIVRKDAAKEVYKYLLEHSFYAAAKIIILRTTKKTL